MKKNFFRNIEIITKALIILKGKGKKDLFYIFILAFFVFLSSKAIFHPGFFRTIDDITTVRIVYMEKELKRNNWFTNFPVRLSGELSNNYGYPLYLYYAPLTYYTGALLKSLLGVSHIVATKYVYVFPLIFGPFAFYFAARFKMGAFAALIASVFFTLFPYRGFNTYILGAVGQAWAISFIPLAIGGLFLLQQQKRAGRIIFAVALFLVLVSHTLTGVLFISLVLLFAFFFLLKNKDFWKSFLLGLGLSAFYLLPMIYYLKIVKVTYLDINNTYILKTLLPLSEILKVQFYKPVTTGEGLLSQITVILFCILFFTLSFFTYKKLKGQRNLKEIFFWGITGIVFFALLFKPFSFFWQMTFPITGKLQFAWRLLALLSFIVPLFLGFWLDNIKNLYLKISVAIIIIGISLSFLPAFKPEVYSYFYEYKPEGLCATTSWQDEYLPNWVMGCPPPKNTLQASPETKIDVLNNNSLLIKANITAVKKDELIVNKYFFPGWHVIIDGKDSPFDYHFSVDGIFKTSLVPGQHYVEVIYKKTLIMWLADLISLIAFCLLFYFILMANSRKNNTK